MECPDSGQALKSTRRRELNLDTVAGGVKLWARFGHSVKKDQWICPARVTWGLKPYERKSPELQARLAYTATVVGVQRRLLFPARLRARFCSIISLGTVTIEKYL